MIEKGLILTGDDAELLSRTLSDIKTRAYEGSGNILNGAQALDTLISRYKAAEKGGEEKETFHTDVNPLSKTPCPRYGNRQARRRPAYPIELCLSGNI